MTQKGKSNGTFVSGVNQVAALEEREVGSSGGRCGFLLGESPDGKQREYH
jgi:hypothetical protein